MDLVPPCTVVPEFASASVDPPPVSVVAGFFSAPVSKSSNIPGGIYGDAVQVGVIDAVLVTVDEMKSVGVMVMVKVGVIVGV